jgi:hypothetical protein
MSLLFDFYGETLTEKQQTLFDLYYNQDLSLGEIAENEGISRQGVHDAIARAEAALLDLEQDLGCVARARRIDEIAAQIAQAARALPDGAETRRIISLAESLPTV